MKLIIDTTDKDNVKASYVNLDTQELGCVLGKIVENIAKKTNNDADELKIQFVCTLSAALLKSEKDAEIKSAKPWECEGND
jgi:hypothetical protein